MYYTLRTLTKEHLLTDELIGRKYQLINRFENYDKFQEVFKQCFLKDHVADSDESADRFTKNCYAFLILEDGSVLKPLYMDKRYYVMTESGKTFSNVSYR
jgi:hypothetical protein